MSFKFRRDGAVFPTKVENGELHISMGPLTLKVPFKFLPGLDSPWDNTDFPMCNVMCYLKHTDGIVIMRFDGTATKLNKDNVVIGMSKFDREDIYKHVQYIPTGIVGHESKGGINKHTLCTIYTIQDCGYYILECVGDPEPIVFYPNDNPQFMEDILKGNRWFPRLVNVSTNVYADDTGKYTVKGSAIKTSGFVNI